LKNLTARIFIMQKETENAQIEGHENHPLADMFPQLSDVEQDKLTADIAKNGQLEPILIYEGKILDGRNRHKSCLALGKTPKIEEYQGDSPLSFVISKNVMRRHLNKSQLAMIAEKFATMQEGRPKKTTQNLGVSLAVAAKMFGVSHTLVEQARKVRREAIPEVIEAVEAGKISVNIAVAFAQATPEQQREVIANGSTEAMKAAIEIMRLKVKAGAEEGTKSERVAGKDEKRQSAQKRQGKSARQQEDTDAGESDAIVLPVEQSKVEEEEQSETCETRQVTESEDVAKPVDTSEPETSPDQICHITDKFGAALKSPEANRQRAKALIDVLTVVLKEGFSTDEYRQGFRCQLQTALRSWNAKLSVFDRAVSRATDTGKTDAIKKTSAGRQPSALSPEILEASRNRSGGQNFPKKSK
jgi:hypothetical protein